MIKITNVDKTYAKSAVKAVEDLSLEVFGGEIFGFLGPNGAGKSTTIKMLTGILNSDSGSIEIDGIDIKKDPILAKQKIGYVPDNHETFDSLKGIEYLNFIGTMYNVGEQLPERINHYAEVFSMTESLGNLISSYSHGMKQKVMVIASLIVDPAVWILDEPLTGLDPQSAFIIKKIMRERADKGKTVFFSSHVIDVVEKVCDRVGIIQKGKLVAVGTLDQLKKDSNKSLEEVFLTLTDSSVVGGEDETI